MDNSNSTFALFLCGACLLAGLIFTGKTVKFLKNSSVVHGQVISVQRIGAKQFKAQIKYLVNDVPYTAEFETGSGIKYSQGQSVEVRYDNKNPQIGRNGSFINLWAFPLAFFSIGILVPLFSKSSQSK